MVTEELKCYIRHSQENDRFNYSANALKRILKSAGGWKKDWLTVFMLILARIKKGYGTQDGANTTGRVVALPVDKARCMEVFFTPQPEKRYLIYDFKIYKRK